MNRKNFLATLGAALVAPFLPKMSASAKSPNLVGADKRDFDALEQSLHENQMATNESIKSVDELTKIVDKSNHSPIIIPATQEDIDWWEQEIARIKSIPLDSLLGEIARDTHVSLETVSRGAQKLIQLGVTEKRFLVQRLRVSIECAQEIGLI